MAWDDDLDTDEIVWWVGVALAGYALLNYMRGRTATDQYGAVFQSQAPSGAEFSSVAEIIAPLQVSGSGIAFIMREEGFSPNIKNDAGRRMIGYGHDLVAGDKFQGPISKAAAAQLLNNDLAVVASALNRAITVPVSQDQFDALASWAYNVGTGAMAKSTLIRMLNQRNYAGAAAQFSQWNRSQGRVNAGLTARRGREGALFDGGAYA